MLLPTVTEAEGTENDSLLHDNIVMKQVKDQLFHVKSIDQINGLERVVRKLRSSKPRTLQSSVTVQKVKVDSSCAEMYISDDLESRAIEVEKACTVEKIEAIDEGENQITDAADLAATCSPKLLRNNQGKGHSLEVFGTAMKIITSNTEPDESASHGRTLRSSYVKEKLSEVFEKNVKRNKTADKVEESVGCLRTRKGRAVENLGRAFEMQQQYGKSIESNEAKGMNLRNSSCKRKLDEELDNDCKEIQKKFGKVSNSTANLPKTSRSFIKKPNFDKFREDSEGHNRTLRSSLKKHKSVINHPYKALRRSALTEFESTDKHKPFSKTRSSDRERDLFEAISQNLEFQETSRQDEDMEGTPRILRSSTKPVGLKEVSKTLSSLKRFHPEPRRAAVKPKNPTGEINQESFAVNKALSTGSSIRESLKIIGKSMKIHKPLNDTAYEEPTSCKRTLRSSSGKGALPHIVKADERECVTEHTPPAAKDRRLVAPKCKRASHNVISKMTKFKKTLEKEQFRQIVSRTALRSSKGRRNKSSENKADFIKSDKQVSESQADSEKSVFVGNSSEKAVNLNNSSKITSSFQTDYQISPKYKSAKTLQVCRKWKKKKLGFWDRKLEQILLHIRSRDYHRKIIGIQGSR